MSAQGNDTSEMKYLSSLISKWMPEKSKVAVDSHPRLSGIMDTINSTLAHGPKTRLPAPFYDAKARAIIDKIGVEEWFSGFKESNEYRQLGCGALAGDIVARMVGSVEKSGEDGLLETGGDNGRLDEGRGGEKALKFGLSGCHDTTLASLLSSLGTFDGEPWPPYTSHIAFELFRASETEMESIGGDRLAAPATAPAPPKQNQGGLRAIFGSAGKTKRAPEGMSRKRTENLSPQEREKLSGHYVRVRYNDRPVVVPGCRLPGKHLEGDESFCTLVSHRSLSSVRVCWMLMLMLMLGRRRSRPLSTNSPRGTGRRLAYQIWTSQSSQKRSSQVDIRISMLYREAFQTGSLHLGIIDELCADTAKRRIQRHVCSQPPASTDITNFRPCFPLRQMSTAGLL